MIGNNSTSTSCECGRGLSWNSSEAPENLRELTCDCGRKYELERNGSAWAPRHEALTPEARQPLAGFSRELKLREDCERYYFSHAISGHRVPVHILFSRSAEEAEVKSGDRKPFRIAPVRSPLEARRRWIEWFDSRPRGDGGPAPGADRSRIAPNV